MHTERLTCQVCGNFMEGPLDANSEDDVTCVHCGHTVKLQVATDQLAERLGAETKSDIERMFDELGRGD